MTGLHNFMFLHCDTYYYCQP